MLIESKTIRLRLVEQSDAEFILCLRVDKKYNQFLSIIRSDLQSQKNWIKQYKIDEKAEKQFYFIIENSDGVPCGTVRIYDLKEDSFCWGSWIVKHDAPIYTAIESMLLIYEFGFNYLGKEAARIDVRNDNIRVIALHKNFGAQVIKIDEVDTYFILSKERYLENFNRFKKYIN
jgi:RimJ/RimL family protein N-acetyltransferase